MFRFFCILSIITAAIFLATTIADIGNLPILISCVLSAIMWGCIAAFQTNTINSIATINKTLDATQKRCQKLEEEITKLKNQK